MYLIGKTIAKKTVGWLHQAKGKRFIKDGTRSEPVIVTWTRVAPNAKIYQTSEDAHYICEMVWGERKPTGILVQEVSADQIQSGVFNISEMEKNTVVAGK